MDSMDGVISRVMYHATSQYDPGGIPFCIARLTNGTTVKGRMSRPIVGENYRFWGETKPSNNGYQDAFCFESFEALMDRSAVGAEQYLSKHIDGVGRAKAAALAEQFGADTLDILRSEPERALEVQGITPEIVQTIKDHFADLPIDPVAIAKLTDLFRRNDHRVSQRLINEIVRLYRSDAPDLITMSPYLLMNFAGIGWKTVDSFAITTAKYDPAGLARQSAAIAEAITMVCTQGHTCCTKTEAATAAFKLLGYLPSDAAWEHAEEFGAVCFVGDGLVTVPKLDDAERSIAASLTALANAAEPLAFKLDRTGLVGDQLAAVDVIERHGVALLIGPPGCGKSWTVATIVKSLMQRQFGDILLCAPTGKAAKRLRELMGKLGLDLNAITTSTIHRALAPTPRIGDGAPKDAAKTGRARDEFSFGHGPGNPLKAKLVVIDEASMVDVKLAASLLAAISPGTRLLIVGDQHQLPSVGPGSFLRDCIAAGLPTAELTEIKRSDGGGRVVRGCHAIKDGRTPEPADSLVLPTENWIHLEENDPNKIAATIVDLHGLASNFDRFWDLQVVSPQRSRSAIGCDNLNRLIGCRLNPEWHKHQHEQGTPDFVLGDKVIRRKNGLADGLELDPKGEHNWQGKSYSLESVPIVNGDMGTIRDIVVVQNKSWVYVEFRDPSRLVRLPYADHQLQLAYAITVHSAQGSGFPVTIVPVHSSFYFDEKSGTGLWCRELFYTAISRAEQILITVGESAQIRTAVRRPTVDRRHTRLAGLIGLAFAGRLEAEVAA